MSGATILIVDDNADNREVYRLLLELSGYSVLRAADGWSGVQQARLFHPDLILMDISMPVMDGFEATELLRLGADTRGIPIIAVTAHDDSDHRRRAAEVGMSGYLAKPAPLRCLLQEVERCLGNGSSGIAPLASQPPECDRNRRRDPF